MNEATTPSPGTAGGAGGSGGPGERLTVPLDGSVPADRNLLGGKGWGLLRMHQLGLPVPPAFTLTTAACRRYVEHGDRVPDELWDRVRAELAVLEQRTGSRLGGPPPLLVSVRSGAPVSMPGMMDTVLNVGRTPPRERALEELRAAVCRVFDSWRGDRARAYRAAHGIPDDLGTAVTVQAMVFGDRDDRSGTGVYVTRDPVTGEPAPFGEWLPRAQGEELVGGRTTPRPLAELRRALPEVYERLLGFGRRLERAHRDVLEIEFTVESGVLHLLQARTSTSTPLAAARWAVDLVREGVITIPQALARVDVERAASPRAVGVGGSWARVVATGVGVAPGAA
ncbi:PEP/pyruvate-binding domain-containing protein, partial [Streptomyces sp. 4N509B]|uniref:PEP/pyruvate-binding domain-containing protein n=1 Tax=Streptomyces sp. 4N509B TaxID=3457413 RepID=UPI003FD03B15